MKDSVSSSKKSSRLFTEFEDLPPTHTLNKKVFLWSLAALFLLTIPGAIGLILTLAASRARTRVKEEKLLFQARIWNILATVLGIFYIAYSFLMAAV